jgi:hypothetical protein
MCTFTPSINLATAPMSVESPHIRRCLPSNQISPGLVIGSADDSCSALATSKSSSCICPLSRAIFWLNLSTSSSSKPVRRKSKPSDNLNSCKISFNFGKSNSPEILFNAILRAFSLSESMSKITQSMYSIPSCFKTLNR